MPSAPSVGAPDGSGSSPIGQTASLSLVLRVHGEGFLLADAAEKDARLAAFGDALASLAREESPVARVTWSQLVAPAPLDGHFAYLAQTSRAEPDEAIASSYGDLLEGTARRAVSSEVLVTLTVAIGRARLGRGEMSERFSSAIDRLLDEAELFSTALARAGLFAVGPLPAGAIARALRDRLDPTARRHLERRGRSLADLAGLVTPENGFPLSVEEHRRFVRDRRELSTGSSASPSGRDSRCAPTGSPDSSASRT